MSGEIITAADVVTGAAIAQAVEPDAGSQAASPNTSTTCLNCGAAVTTAFCGSCGQKAVVHRTLAAFWHDLVHSVFHFDGKIWRTLPMLALKPGHLTRRYVHGERAKFVSPLALFLFTVFLMFAVFNSILPSAADFDTEVNPEKAAAAIQQERQTVLTEIAKLEKEKAELTNDPVEADLLTGEIDRAKAELDRIDVEEERLKPSQIASSRMLTEKRLAESKAIRLEAEIAAAEKAGRDTKALEEQLQAEQLTSRALQTASNMSNGMGRGEANTGITWLDEAIEHAAENPKLLLYKMQSSAYKYSWALIPLSVPCVWLMFAWRRQYKMFDHAVFVTYSICFMMLLFTVGAILLQFNATSSAAAIGMALIPPVHMYKQIKYSYKTSRIGAFLRMGLLQFFAVMVLLMFTGIVLTLGVL
jgi:Protein of unknown function (DUF3667)